MPWEAGESGNQSGRPKGVKSFKAALERALKKQPEAIDQIAAALIKQAATGDMQAIKEFADRMDGKAAQAIEHSVAKSHEEQLNDLARTDIDDATREGNTSPPA